MYRPENPSQDDGTIDPTLYRYSTLSSLDIPILSLECGKPWTKGDGDNIEEPNQRCKETTGDQKTEKRGCLKQVRCRHPVSSPKDGLQPGNRKCKTVTEEE
jgi:hypothetical protein